jgi:phosphomannomutase
LRGLAVELTSGLVSDYVAAFLTTCSVGSGLYLGRDLRASSPRIAEDVMRAAQAAGVIVTNCGPIPTPALAMAALSAGAAAVMVTGSHIPADRNGLKFYSSNGEITKADELAILSALGKAVVSGSPKPVKQLDPGQDFVARYVAVFGATALVGQRIGVWSHSAVGGRLLIDTLRSIGANVTEIAPSKVFIPVDTEAVSEADRSFLRGTVQALGLNALVSTDGDGDRPLLVDETGEVIPGDILGQITARFLEAHTVVTPVSANTGVELGGRFARVIRTRIGSPYVINEMKACDGRTVGYEPNGGFLLGFDFEGPFGTLYSLMTRDSHLPILACLLASRSSGLSNRVMEEPSRFTSSDRVRNVQPSVSQALIASLSNSASSRVAFLQTIDFGALHSVDVSDGLRLVLDTGRIVHLRSSGNAPELRVYVEAESRETASAMIGAALGYLEATIAQESE